MSDVNKSRILLVWPKVESKDVLPLAYLNMVGILAPEYDIRLVDMTLGQDLRGALSGKPAIVGVSGWSTQVADAISILNTVRAYLPDARTIVGGPHFSVVRDYDPRLINYAVVGESEHIILDLVKAIINDGDVSEVDNVIQVTPNGLIESKRKSEVTDLDSIGVPDYRAIYLEDYLAGGYKYKDSPWKNAPIMATRGCPYDCQFCSAGILVGHKLRKYSLNYMFMNIKRLYDIHGVRHFNIVDDNFTFDMDHAKQFCYMILANRKYLPGISFATPNGVRLERLDPELLGLMRIAGWYKITIAPETGSPKIAKLMHKALDLKKVKPAVEMIHDAGLLCEGFFIVGYPGETTDTLRETFNFITEIGLDDVGIHRFQPLVGTPIYDELIKNGVISSSYLPRSYNLYDTSDGYVPPGFESQQFKTLLSDGIKGINIARGKEIMERWGIVTGEQI